MRFLTRSGELLQSGTHTLHCVEFDGLNLGLKMLQDMTYRYEQLTHLNHQAMFCILWQKRLFRNSVPLSFSFHLHKSIMAFSVWWHFNTHKCMQWGGSVLHHSPVWRFKLGPFLLNSLYYLFLVIGFIMQAVESFRVGTCVFKNR